MIAAADNNPLKLTATPDEAVRWLVQPVAPATCRRTRRSPPRSPTSRLSCPSWSRPCSTPCATCCTASTRRRSRRRWPMPRCSILAAGGRKAKYWELFRERYGELAREAEREFLREVGADFGRGRRRFERGAALMPLMRRAALRCCPAPPWRAVGCSAATSPSAAPTAPAATIVSLTLKASPDVNAETDGTGRPVQVRVLSLPPAGISWRRTSSRWTGSGGDAGQGPAG